MAVDGINRVSGTPEAAGRIQKSAPEQDVSFPDIDNLKKLLTQAPAEKSSGRSGSRHTTVVENGREVVKSVNNDTLLISPEGKMASGYFQALTGSFEAMYGSQPELSRDRILDIYSDIFDRLMTAVEQSFTGTELTDNESSLQKAYNDILTEYGALPSAAAADAAPENAAPAGTASNEAAETSETELLARELLTRYSGAGDLNSAIASAFVQLNSKSPGTISYTQLYKLAVSMNLTAQGQQE